MLKKLIVIANVAFLLGAMPARAQSDADEAKARAKARSRVAEKLFRVGNFARAAEEFKAAYEDYPAPFLLYNLGQTYRQLEDYKQSILFFRQFLATSPEAPERASVEVTIQQLRELDARRLTRLPEPTSAPTKGTSPPLTSTAPTTAAAAPSTSARHQRPIYKRAWFWGTLVGAAALIATGVTLGAVYGGPTRDPVPSIGVASVRGF